MAYSLFYRIVNILMPYSNGRCKEEEYRLVCILSLFTFYVLRNNTINGIDYDATAEFVIKNYPFKSKFTINKDHSQISFNIDYVTSELGIKENDACILFDIIRFYWGMNHFKRVDIINYGSSNRTDLIEKIKSGAIAFQYR